MCVASAQEQFARSAKHYPLIRQVFDLASDRGIRVYLVGGTVRDLVLGKDTHDLDFAQAVADRWIVLHEGRVVADGAPEVLRGDKRLVQIGALPGTEAENEALSTRHYAQ